jgi:PPM family protein phosphatase
MARGGRPRPTPFPQGTKLGEYFQVEGLVRLAEGRMFYLLNDDRPEQPNRKCWQCGFETSPRSADACHRCGATLKENRFLMSVRWDPKNYEAYQDFVKRAIPHPAVVSPVAILAQDGLLCSIVRYQGESLLLDECAPFAPRELLFFSQRIIGLLGLLAHNGVLLQRLSAANFLLDSEHRALLYDPEVKQLQAEPIPPSDQERMVRELTNLLRRFCPVSCLPLWALFERAEDGAFPDTASFGDALMKLAEELEEASDPPPAAALTDVGLCRDLNEDTWGWTEIGPDMHLYVVGDGMGGHDSGEIASELAVRTICKAARERIDDNQDITPEVLENILDEAFQLANNTVKESAERRGNDMGTTLVALLSVKDQPALLANVGDSRGYLLRDKVLHQVTRDHSLVARMVEQSRITQDEARNHPHSNILLRTVGTERNVEIDIFSIAIEKGDRILLCSDGLWGEVEDGAIEVILNHFKDLRMACRELVRAAHQGGGKDNITLLVVEPPPSARAGEDASSATSRGAGH